MAKRNCTIDIIRLIMAICIVALHSSPFIEYSAIGSYFVCQIISRIGVPFFAAVAGYYFFASANKDKYKKTFLRYLRLYVIWSLIMFCYEGYQRLKSGGGISESLKYLLHIFFLDGYYHLWYILAILYTIVLIYLLNKLFENSLKIAYKVSFFLLILGVLCFNYGNAFLKIPLINATLGRFNYETTMPEQWLFIVVPFFMMGYGLREKKNNWLNKYSEVLMLIVALFYLLEVVLSTVLNLKASTTMCFAMYPLVYFMLLSAFKHPYTGHTVIAKYCSGIASFIYFGHILVVLVLQATGVSETPVFIVTLIVTGIIGAVFVTLDDSLLNHLIR